MASDISRDLIIQHFRKLQDRICSGLEVLDGTASFDEDQWERPGGGGGRTRIIEGQHIEKGGVNFSAVHGSMPGRIAEALGLPPNQFLATGVSIVLHPKNPWVPIIHMNVRYFETDQGQWWFGGGIDATPHIILPEQARHFHHQLKEACDILDPGAYGKYKDWADDYFYIPHRNETRGIGGIFFDRLDESKGYSRQSIWNFVKSVGDAFLPAYEALFRQNFEKEYTRAQKEWQFIRRGRYVEFNLVYDRGTKFGLQTAGRIESILMSLPPEANWKYNYEPNPFESETQRFLSKGIDWLNYREGQGEKY